MASRKSSKAYRALPFPGKLFAMLEDAENHGFDHIVSWQPLGKSFKVHQTGLFVDEIIQQYFSQTKYKSFQRQLNIYGWKKIHHGPNLGGYTHKYFMRTQPELWRRMTPGTPSNESAGNSEQKKNTTVPLDAPTSSSTQSDRLSSMFPLPSDPPGPTTSELGKDSLYNFFNATSGESSLTGSQSPNNSSEDGDSWSKGLKATSDDLEVFANDGFERFSDTISYGDWENLSKAVDVDTDRSSNSGKRTPETADSSSDSQESLEEDFVFPFKLHLMLDDAEAKNYSHIVSWVRDGKAFKVHDSDAFVSTVLPNFFEHSKYESFRRQLNLYGFRRVARGKERGVVWHPSFIAGSRHLCKNIRRKRPRSGVQRVAATIAHRRQGEATSGELQGMH